MSDLLPVFPLSTVIFPGVTLPLHVFEHRYRVMTKECLGDDGEFGIVLISRGSEVGGGETRVSVGTAARIEEVSLLPDGRSVVLARGTRRFRVVEWLADDPYPRAIVEWLLDPPDEVSEPGLLARAVAAVRRARALLSELKNVPVLATKMPVDDDARTWWLCDQVPTTALDRQCLLECNGIGRRLELVTELASCVGDDLTLLLASG